MPHTTCNHLELERPSTFLSSPYPATPLYARLLTDDISASRHNILLTLRKHQSEFHNAIDPLTSALNPFVSSLLDIFKCSIHNAFIPYHCNHFIESAQNLPIGDFEAFEWFEQLYQEAVALREAVKLVQGIIYHNQGEVEGWLDAMKSLGEWADAIEEMLRKEYLLRKAYRVKKLVAQLRERVGMLDKAVAELEKEEKVGQVDEWIEFEVLKDLDEAIAILRIFDTLKRRG